MAVVVAGMGVARPAGAAAPSELALGTGGNDSGTIGDGSTTERDAPVRTRLPRGVSLTQESGGDGHTLGLTSDGRVLAWGRNDVGQLGDGTSTLRTTPVFVRLPAGVMVTQVAAGGDHSLALTSDGRLLTWGRNTSGQLGDGTATARATPVFVRLPTGVTVTRVSGGSYHSLALASDGRVLAWGDNVFGELGVGGRANRETPVFVRMPKGTKATAIDAGRNSQSFAVTPNGRLLAWGRNDVGQLGDGTRKRRTTPVWADVPSDESVTQVAAGGDHSLALTSEGHILVWGANKSGQLGPGPSDIQKTPIENDMPNGVTITQVAAGASHSLALTSDGRVLAWGANHTGQIGGGAVSMRSSLTFMPLPKAAGPATAVAANSDTSLVLAHARSTSTTTLTATTEKGGRTRLKAKVTCGNTTPTGPVTFLEGNTVVGATDLDAAATATLTPSGLAKGAHHLIARYEGNALCSSSTSQKLTIAR
ncbi:Ig-like domain repeat protein [Actinomadura oligospora]|uniref:RCC1 domain-containing protein n=1 Tax=Actinomadura oligospora TaxID=111804 RepID=UPI0014741807|nr:Ig-like domain repeat protein [Actinomadura oligospora]